MARDNFKPSDIERLAKRVAYLCSSPDCEVVTIGPTANDSETSNIGVAAHICAAAPGGPRFDTRMTAEQRSNIRNAIWLCHSCSRKIDNDAASYPVDLLQRWKARAEAHARSRHGRRHLQQRDVQDQMRAVLGAMPASYHGNAISNVHKASKEALESLDPRFSIETSYADGQPNYKLHALEPVPVRFKVPPHRAPAWRKGITELVAHGRKARIDLNDIYIEGSPLLDKLFSDSDSRILEISPVELRADVQLILLDRKTGIQQELDPMAGTCTGGIKSFSVEARTADKTLSVGLEQSFEPSKESDSVLYFELDSSAWDEKDVRFLLGFRSAHRLFSGLRKGKSLLLNVFVNGHRVCQATYHLSREDDFICGQANNLDYLDRVRRIADFLDLDIRYRDNYEFTAEQHKAAAEVVDIIEGRHEGAITSNIEATLEVVTDDIEVLRKTTAVLQFSSKDPGPEVDLFGQKVQTPSLQITVTNVKAKLPKNVRRGDTIKAIWQPLRNSRCRYSFQANIQANSFIAPLDDTP